MTMMLILCIRRSAASLAEPTRAKREQRGKRRWCWLSMSGASCRIAQRMQVTHSGSAQFLLDGVGGDSALQSISLVRPSKGWSSRSYISQTVRDTPFRAHRPGMPCMHRACARDARLHQKKTLREQWQGHVYRPHEEGILDPPSVRTRARTPGLH